MLAGRVGVKHGKGKMGGTMRTVSGAKRKATGAKREKAGVKRKATGAKREATGAKREATGAKRETTGAKRKTTGAKREIKPATVKLNPGPAAKPGSAWAEIYAIVGRIPRGRVVNYGQIAGMLDRSLSAQAVGWAMRQCPEGLPWHRVVNAAGGCSTEGLGASPLGLQRAMLEAEGITFGSDDTLDLDRYRWRPRRRRSV